MAVVSPALSAGDPGIFAGGKNLSLTRMASWADEPREGSGIYQRTQTSPEPVNSDALLGHCVVTMPIDVEPTYIDLVCGRSPDRIWNFYTENN